jgi:hypothetical protein
MKKHKRWIFLGISLTAVILFFFFAYEQDYAKTADLASKGLNPSFTFHWLALISIIVGGIFWWALTLTFFKTTIRSSWKQLWKDLYLSFPR